MKKLTFVLISAAISLSACSSNRTASREYDDVYYSDRDAIADDYSRSNNTQQSNSNNNGSNENASEPTQSNQYDSQNTSQN